MLGFILIMSNPYDFHVDDFTELVILAVALAMNQATTYGLGSGMFSVAHLGDVLANRHGHGKMVNMIDHAVLKATPGFVHDQA